MTASPKAKERVMVRVMDDECLLYDEENGRVHVLNRMAGFVWGLCDGSHSLREMEQKVREAYDVPSNADLAADIGRFVTGLAALGLIADVGDRT